MSPKFVDLFAGIGGMRLGLEAAGLECVYSSEWDPHAQLVYQENFGEKPEGDITKIDANSIPDHDVLAAGFPCQPFSISGSKRGFEDTRGTLFFDILRVLETKKPSVVLLENVKFLQHHDSGNTLRVMLKHLDTLGYKVSWKTLNAKDFGLAQNRERVVVVGVLGGKQYFDFDQLETGVDVNLRTMLDSRGDFDFLDKTDYTIIEKSLWKKQASGLIFVGHRNKSLRKSGVREGTAHLSRAHKQPNRIYHVDGKHPTLPSQEVSGRFWIYDEAGVRKLTIDECFRLMGFPDDFKKPGSLGDLYQRIGNSIAVPMVTSLGRLIIRKYL